jgi:hypothetical protein
MSDTTICDSENENDSDIKLCELCLDNNQSTRCDMCEHKIYYDCYNVCQKCEPSLNNCNKCNMDLCLECYNEHKCKNK